MPPADPITNSSSRLALLVTSAPRARVSRVDTPALTVTGDHDRRTKVTVDYRAPPHGGPLNARPMTSSRWPSCWSPRPYRSRGERPATFELHGNGWASTRSQAPDRLAQTTHYRNAQLGLDHLDHGVKLRIPVREPHPRCAATSVTF